MQKRVSHLPSIHLKGTSSENPSESVFKPQLTLPSDVKKFHMISGVPNKEFSHRGPMDSYSDINRMSIPLSSLKVRKYPCKPRVQSARRMQSLGSKNKKFSKTQNFFPGGLGETGNKTMNTLERKTCRSRTEVKGHPIGQTYLNYRRNSIASEKRTSRDSKKKHQIKETFNKNKQGFSIMKFDEIDLGKSLLKKNKFWVSEEEREKKNFFMMKNSKNEENQNVFNTVGLLKKKRNDMFEKIMKNHNNANVSQAQILKILKQTLKNKKKNILKTIQENKALEYKWRNLNIKNESFQKSKIQKFEYLKKLLLREKSNLTKKEISIVSNIDKISKPQIQLEMSKILSQETQFVSFDKGEITQSNVTQKDEKYQDRFKMMKKSKPVPRIYSDEVY